MTQPLATSVTRISDLSTEGFETRSLPREHWDSGDYVIARVSNKVIYILHTHSFYLLGY